MHQVETKPNWTMVSVTGCAKTLSMDFEDVFVKAEVVYQIMQRIYNPSQLSFRPLCTLGENYNQLG
jgi:hypothetical protein